ncbi:Conserved_hypothetical protein [Hexamita inflata]|uniref:Uncharacterized protein n=1 Tax=Hexamita inflata TaxID=28002 RepID=A0AA86NXC9_9EUKA|nr:Conserved hypothetical protein [Hexamita inflata]
MFQQWYDQAKQFIATESYQNVEYQQLFANNTVQYVQQIVSKCSKAQLQESIECVSEILSIIQEKPKFSPLQQNMGKVFEFTKILTRDGLQDFPQESLKLLQVCTQYKNYATDDLTILNLCQLLPKMESRKLVSTLLTRLCDFPDFSDVFNQQTYFTYTPKQQIAQRYICELCANSTDLDLFILALQTFQIINSDIYSVVLQKIPHEQQQVLINALLQSVSAVSTPNATQKLLVFIAPFVKSLGQAEPFIALLSMKPNIPLLQFMFQFPLQAKTFQYLMQFQFNLQKSDLQNYILMPVLDFCQKLPKIILDNEVVNEAAQLVLQIFQSHFAADNESGAAGQILCQIMAELLRRGYGQNERFTPMVKKIIRNNQAAFKMLFVDQQFDTLSDLKILAQIIIELVEEVKDEHFGAIAADLFEAARFSNIALQAINELLDAKNARLCAALTVDNIEKMLSRVAHDEMHLDLLEQFVQKMPLFVLENKTVYSHVIIYSTMTCIICAFGNKPQFIDRLTAELFKSLFQLDMQYLNAPNNQIISSLLPNSNICAPYLALYLPEIFINHFNPHAKAAAFLFLGYKYGMNYLLNDPVILQQRQYFSQYLPQIIPYCFKSVVQGDLIMSCFQNELKVQYKVFSNHQLNNCKLQLITRLSQFSQLCQQTALDLVQQTAINYGKTTQSKDKIEIAGFKAAIEQLPNMNLKIDFDVDLTQICQWLLQNTMQMCGCGCNIGGWADISKVFEQAGVE